MSHFIKRAAAAAVLIAALPFSAEAFPIATAPAAQADAGVTLVSGGCGPGFHRGPLLGCRPNRMVVVGPVDPSAVLPDGAAALAPSRLPLIGSTPRARPVGSCPPDLD